MARGGALERYARPSCNTRKAGLAIRSRLRVISKRYGDPTGTVGIRRRDRHIGVHAFNLVEYVSGHRVSEICADLSSVVAGRSLDDDCNVLLKLDNGSPGILLFPRLLPAIVTICSYISTAKRAPPLVQENPIILI